MPLVYITFDVLHSAAVRETICLRPSEGAVYLRFLPCAADAGVDLRLLPGATAASYIHDLNAQLREPIANQVRSRVVLS